MEASEEPAPMADEYPPAITAVPRSTNSAVERP